MKKYHMDFYLLGFLLIFWFYDASTTKVITDVHSDGTPIKVCYGTNNRLSASSIRARHYRNLRDRFANCTYVDGNLELTWLQNEQDLSFLQQIREVTGYVLISHVDHLQVILPRLQIIRGEHLLKLNVMKEQFALFVTYSQMVTLELPELREILTGSVGFVNNFNLCHIRNINWKEIMADPNEKFIYSYNTKIAERDCPSCHSGCNGEPCWGDGIHNCQKFTKLKCSAICTGGRCFGPNSSQCCHPSCAGGCTGTQSNNCLACRTFLYNGECKDNCRNSDPSQEMMATLNVTNTKYAYGKLCVRKCPQHLLIDNGTCVPVCPKRKTAKNGICHRCNGTCPKTCPGTGIVHANNIKSFKRCTIIEGSLQILDQTFNGYQQVYSNFTFGPRIKKLHPHRLKIFETLREVTGFVNIQGYHPNFTNLSYFRNLETIGGRQLMDVYFASLFIGNTALRSLDLISLKRIESGAVVILQNEDLCFVNDINWSKLRKLNDRSIIVVDNKNDTECSLSGQICSEQCTNSGCWGTGPTKCLECRNIVVNGTCVNSL